MGKFDGILICTDLDGTLYKNDKTISRENKEAIEYFKSEGGYFTFITGRLPYYSDHAFNEVMPNAPFGCINGGGLYDGTACEYVWRLELDSSYIKLARHISDSFVNVGIQLCSFEKTYFARENEATERFRERTGVPSLCCDLWDFDEPLGKVIFCSLNNDELTEVERELRLHPLADRFDFMRSERTLLEILPKGVDKGLALSKLTECLDIDISRTVAIGDFDNDVAMLRLAGCGFAVSNASRSAMEAADFITVSNEEHAIARVIYDIESYMQQNLH